MKIEHTISPEKKDIDFLCQMINEENPEKEAIHNFAFFIRDNDNKIIAGCNGYVIFGVIFTEQLWVDKNYRKQGLAKKLMQQVHDYGMEARCKMATICTMSFQKALSFYEKLGYVIDFKREGYVDGSSLIYLKKDLNEN